MVYLVAGVILSRPSEPTGHGLHAELANSFLRGD